jgi:hypothetical protein
VAANNNATDRLVGNSQTQTSQEVGEMGGAAARGDNCAIIHNMAIGLPVPGAKQKSLNGQPIAEYNNSATITSMSTITVMLAGGDLEQLGFLYGTKGDGYFFAPDIKVRSAGGPFTVQRIIPPVFHLPSSNVNSPTDIKAIAAAFNAVVSNNGDYVDNKTANGIVAALNDRLNRASRARLLGTTNCFTKALPRNA